MQPEEGVIKFSAAHDERVLSARRFGELACKLIAWRALMAHTGMLGQDPARYAGAGFGNVSGRVGAPAAPRRERAFLITGTQTGGLSELELGHFCLVRSCDHRLNRVVSRGAILPSSESLTHGAIYDLSPHIRFVLHGHAPAIWRRAAQLRLPTTDPSVPYGTPQMAAEVVRLYRDTPLSERKILAMGGHEDGVIVFGHTPGEAGQTLLAALASAYEVACAARL